MMLTMPTNWQTHASWIEDQGTEGREAVRAALKELVKFGYLVQSRKRNGSKFAGLEWEWKHTPDDGVPPDGFPSHEKPAATKKRIEEERSVERKEKGKGGFVPKRTPWISQFPHQNFTEEDLERGMKIRGVEYDPNRLFSFLEEMHLKGFRDKGKPINDIIGFAIARQELCTPQDWSKPKQRGRGWQRQEYTGGPF